MDRGCNAWQPLVISTFALGSLKQLTQFGESL